MAIFSKLFVRNFLSPFNGGRQVALDRPWIVMVLPQVDLNSAAVSMPGDRHLYTSIVDTLELKHECTFLKGPARDIKSALLHVD